MKIYHGTNFKYLKSILKNGISPRKNKKSNWDKAISHPDMTYLTIAYPFYFSYCSLKKKDHIGVVLEINTDNLDENSLYPDEDFIWFALKQNNKSITIDEVRKNLEIYKDNWLKSIEHLGQCCYKGIIHPSAIKRYCIVDFDKLGSVGMSVLDPSISVLNYKLCKNKYMQQVSWFFGDAENFYEEDNMAGLEDSDMMRQRLEFWKKESKNRNGVTVVEKGI